MEDKDIMSELKLEYRNNIVYFNGLKINAYTAEGMRLISNLLKKGLYEIGKELENVSNSKLLITLSCKRERVKRRE